MTKSKSIIEKVRIKGGTWSDNHICRITQTQHTPKRSYYKNKKTQAEYWHLAGAVAWPGKVPGFVIVVAVDKSGSADESPTLRVLDERENQTVEGLLRDCVSLREKWGYNTCPDLFRVWYGDEARMRPMVSDFNSRFEKDVPENGTSGGVYLASPTDFDAPNCFEIYLQRVLSCLQPDGSGRKRLILGDCDLIRNHLRNLPADAPIKGSVDDFPAVAALGFAVHDVLISKPWLRNVNGPIAEFETIAALEGEVTRRYLGLDEYGEEDNHDYDTKSLI